MIFDILDDDNISSDLIGSVEFHLIQVIERPGEEILQEFPVIDTKKKDSKTIYGNLKLQC